MELGNNLDSYILIRDLLVAYSRQEIIMEERLTQGKSRVEPAPRQTFVIERNIENRSNRGRMLEC